MDERWIEMDQHGDFPSVIVVQEKTIGPITQRPFLVVFRERDTRFMRLGISVEHDELHVILVDLALVDELPELGDQRFAMGLDEDIGLVTPLAARLQGAYE